MNEIIVKLVEKLSSLRRSEVSFDSLVPLALTHFRDCQLQGAQPTKEEVHAHPTESKEDTPHRNRPLETKKATPAGFSLVSAAGQTADYSFPAGYFIIYMFFILIK